MKLLLVLLSVVALGQEKVVDSDVTKGPKIDPSKDLLEQAKLVEKKFYDELPKKLDACWTRHGDEAKAPEGTPDAEKLDRCVHSVFHGSYLPVIKKGFPKYESVCRFDCTPPAEKPKSGNH